MKKTILLFSLILVVIVGIAQNNTSYNANTIPIGGTQSVAIGVQAGFNNTGFYNVFSG